MKRVLIMRELKKKKQRIKEIYIYRVRESLSSRHLVVFPSPPRLPVISSSYWSQVIERSSQKALKAAAISDRVEIVL